MTVAQSMILGFQGILSIPIQIHCLLSPCDCNLSVSNCDCTENDGENNYDSDCERDNVCSLTYSSMQPSL